MGFYCEECACKALISAETYLCLAEENTVKKNTNLILDKLVKICRFLCLLVDFLAGTCTKTFTHCENKSHSHINGLGLNEFQSSNANSQLFVKILPQSYELNESLDVS